ncbi:MAG: hypothetical protein U0175_07750 [Caldilineaceae bacterium]
MATDVPIYRSYILRLWQQTDGCTFRAMLLNVHNPADRHYFINMDDLCFFLHCTQSSAFTADSLPESKEKRE